MDEKKVCPCCDTEKHKYRNKEGKEYIFFATAETSVLRQESLS